MGFFRIPPDPEIVMVCSVCSKELDTPKADLGEACKYAIEKHGWEIGKDSLGYYHLCENHIMAKLIS